MRCENGGPIADEFGAMFLLERFPFEWMQDGSHGLSFVIAGLDPAIHLFAKTLLRSGWTRGSSPRVTPENGRAPSQYERGNFRTLPQPRVTTTLYWANCGWQAIKLSLLILDQDD